MPTTYETTEGTITAKHPYHDRQWMEFKIEGAEHADVTVRQPSGDSSTEIERGCTVSISQGWGRKDATHARKMAALLQVAAQYAEEQDAKLRGKLEEVKAREEAQRKEYERQREARKALLAEREEKLLHEMVGEQARIRMNGYKRWRVVTIEAYERGEGDWHVRLVYKNQQRFGYAEHGIAHVRSLELKVGSRYKSLWDDGQDDLPEWDRKADRGVEQYDGELS